jgi:hypothetical protein
VADEEVWCTGHTTRKQSEGKGGVGVPTAPSSRTSNSAYAFITRPTTMGLSIVHFYRFNLRLT